MKFIKIYILSLLLLGSQSFAALGGAVNVVRFDSIDSTQAHAKRVAKDLPLGWHAFTAEEQTAGVGQRSRKWASPPRVNIYVTYVFPLPITHHKLLLHIPQVATIATAQTLEKFAFRPKIKWINDLLLCGQKVCGVLCESQGSTHEGFTDVFIGIGLNVNMEKSICDRLDQPVTSLRIEKGKELDKGPIFETLTGFLKENIEKLIAENSFREFLPYLNDRLAYRGESVLAIDRDEEFSEADLARPDTKRGILEGVDENGFLLLRKKDDELEVLMNGRVRPAIFAAK